MRRPFGKLMDLLDADEEIRVKNMTLGAVADKYGAWQKKSMYGRIFKGISRTTYLIGPDGKVARRWDKVKVTGHAEDVLAAVKALGD